MTSQPAPVAPARPAPRVPVSRYRSLRGKSVSSPSAFDIFRDCSSSSSSSGRGSSSDGESVGGSVSGGSTSQGRPDSGSLRRRSKSLAHTPCRGSSSSSAAGALTEEAVTPAKAPAESPAETPAEAPAKAPPAGAPASLVVVDSAPPLPTPAPVSHEAAAAEPSRTVVEHVEPSAQGGRKALPEPTRHAADPQHDPDAAVRVEPQKEPTPQPRREAPAPPTALVIASSSREHRDDPAALVADEVARLEAETDRILAEQKKLDLARLQAVLATPPPKPKRSLLAFLSVSRGRRSNASSNAGSNPNSSQPATPSTLSPSIFSPARSHFSRSSSVEPSPLSVKMSFIQPGGKGIVPQVDAPTSAVNGGGRRITVRCLSSTVVVPVTPDTSAVDVVLATADMTSHPITPAACVVIECYSVLGLERRLRRYELLRDVLNSWDHDEQNSLLIMPYDSVKGGQNLDLDLARVPRNGNPPTGFCVQLHHSPRPGKWNKCWVSLLDNGQMFASKRPEAGPSDKDSTLMCHLSDFDIYAPKESEMRRHLKPPKRFCYAIKSQQKTVVFANGENFVHFFCTDDEKLAERFYELVHAWRSWYLANRLVDLARKDKSPEVKPAPLVRRATSSRTGDGGNKSLRVSIDETAFQSAEPLMDVSSFKAPDISELSPVEKPITKQSAGQSRSKSVGGAQESETSGDGQFSAGGLLGEAYDKRRQVESANARAQTVSTKADGPFTEGPSLLNGGVTTSPDSAGTKKPEPKSWFPSAKEHTALLRSQTVHHQRRPMTADAAGRARRDRHPAPLLNLNQDLAEAPSRFRNASGGSGPRYPAGQPLIDFAMGGQGQQPRHGPPQRTMSRRGPPPPSHCPPLPPFRQQSTRSQGRSPASPSQGSTGSRRLSPDGQFPPVPPLPNRSMRRDMHGEPSRGGSAPRFGEPLVNRAR